MTDAGALITRTRELVNEIKESPKSIVELTQHDLLKSVIVIENSHYRIPIQILILKW